MPIKSDRDPGAGRGWALLCGLALLIVYGSLYPFDIAKPEPDALRRLFHDWTLISTRGDMLGNLALFVPWGLAGMLTVAPRRGARRALFVTAFAGFVLALACQIAQLWVPSRSAALADVVWNMLGVAAGLVLGREALRRMAVNAGASAASIAAAGLLGAWLLAYWLPLVPSIDLQLLKDNLKAVLNVGAFSFGAFMPALAMALMSGYLLGRLVGIRASLVGLPAWLALAAVGKLFIHAAHVDISSPLGFIAGAALWWASPWVDAQRRTAIVALVLIAAYTVQGLSPFEFRDIPEAFSWSPMAAMLEGSMLSNAQALVDSVLIFTSFLYLVQISGGRPAVASLGLAVWVLGIEMVQIFIVSRTADITLPLLVILLGQAFRMSRLPSLAAAPQVEAALPAPHATRSGRSILRPLFIALAVVALTVIGLSAMLRLPGIPYNVRELFLRDGHPLALAAFALALLWAGAGSAWLGTGVARTRHPGLLLPPLVLAVSLISLLLLWMSVTTESIGDISGSSNLYWFVTNKDTWGATWRAIFLSLDAPGFISFLERCVRYSALYAPLPIFLGLMIAVRRWPSSEPARPSRVLGVLVSALLTLWLCKAVAFDWSSTDNLNELIARDGEWGWGGGGYLYALLALISLNSLFLAEGIGAHARALLGSLLFTAVAVPLGWWLLNQGLEQEVEKYGSVFSGAQFLLGPDRSHALPAQVLFVRWAAVQVSATLVIATGTWLGLAMLTRARHDLDVGPSSATQFGMTRHPKPPITR